MVVEMKIRKKLVEYKSHLTQIFPIEQLKIPSLFSLGGVTNGNYI
jgi:hypothetical protein